MACGRLLSVSDLPILGSQKNGRHLFVSGFFHLLEKHCYHVSGVHLCYTKVSTSLFDMKILPLCVHSFAAGHVEWIHLLDIMNCAAVYTQVQISVCKTNSLGYVVKSEMAGDNSMLISWEADMLFPREIILFHTPAESVWDFLFLHIFINICYCPFSFLLAIAILWGYKVVHYIVHRLRLPHGYRVSGALKA